MKETNIYTAFKKIFPDNYDAEHYLSVLFSNPENEWFSPTNAENDAYSICEQLGSVNLVAMKRVPVWKDGMLCGMKTSIFYNKNLDFNYIFSIPYK